MNELLREIEEDMRTERMQRVWQRFGKTAIHISIAIIVGTASGVAWQHWRHSVNADRTSELLKGTELLRSGKNKEAIDVFAKIDSDTPHGHMAALGIAQAQLAEGDKDAALRTYETLGKSAGDDAFADLGKLLSTKETDLSVATPSGSAFYASQEEMRGWQFLKAGKKEEAAAVFSALKDDMETPESIRARAHVAMEYLGSK
jgi:hypothetical protein